MGGGSAQRRGGGNPSPKGTDGRERYRDTADSKNAEEKEKEKEKEEELELAQLLRRRQRRRVTDALSPTNGDQGPFVGQEPEEDQGGTAEGPQRQTTRQGTSTSAQGRSVGAV